MIVHLPYCTLCCVTHFAPHGIYIYIKTIKEREVLRVRGVRESQSWWDVGKQVIT
jgi:hypothetical protein